MNLRAVSAILATRRLEQLLRDVAQRGRDRGGQACATDWRERAPYISNAEIDAAIRAERERRKRLR